MRRVLVIITIVLILLVSCIKQSETVVSPVLPFDENLLQIDSLLQQHPDLALQSLLSFQVLQDSSSMFNNNYKALLLSETFYKTDNTQLNRADLQIAMCYFDSLAEQYPYNDDLVMLSARSHYMNGVGYFETDSVIDACGEYLHTLEIMEEHFNEMDFSDYKAKFMGLTYTRLGEMYYIDGIAQLAIKFYKQSLYHFKNVQNYSLANTYRRIGGSYYLNQQADSAIVYYKKAIYLAKQQNKRFVYSASLSESAPIYYYFGYKDSAFRMIKESILLTATEDQRLSKYFTLGLLFLNEHQYDSAINYFQQSIKRNNYDTRTASEEKLAECYHALGDTVHETFYKLRHNESLKLFVENTTVNVELLSLYNKHNLNYAERKHKIIIKQQNHLFFIRLLSVVVIVIFIVFFSVYVHRKKNIVISKLSVKVKAKSFKEEPIVIDILNIVNTQLFKAQMDYRLYADYALGIQQLDLLRYAVDSHFDFLTKYLKDKYPSLTNEDINYCCLFLLGLKDADISALMQRSYRAICDRDKKLKVVFETKDSVYNFLCDTINKRVSC